MQSARKRFGRVDGEEVERILLQRRRSSEQRELMIRGIGQRHQVRRKRPNIGQQPLDAVRWEPLARLLAAAGMDWSCG